MVAHTVGCKVNAAGVGKLRVDCGVISDNVEEVTEALEEIPVVVDDLECKELW